MPRITRIGAAIARGCFGTLLVALTALLAPRSWSQEMVPAGLVRLRDIAPGIHQDIRYATSFNFTGQVVPGYERAECMTRPGVARALARAQARLAAEGLALKVYDCYRPLQAVRAFVVWSRSRGGDTMKPIFYPNLDKSRLFALGYISLYSRHSLGIAIDVGLVREGDSDATPSTGGRCDGPFEQRARNRALISVPPTTAFRTSVRRQVQAFPPMRGSIAASSGALFWPKDSIITRGSGGIMSSMIRGRLGPGTIQ